MSTKNKPKCHVFWCFYRHHYHFVYRSHRKVKAHKEPPCALNKNSIYFDGHLHNTAIKVKWQEKCCLCDKIIIRSEYNCSKQGLGYLDLDDHPL